MSTHKSLNFIAIASACTCALTVGCAGGGQDGSSANVEVDSLSLADGSSLDVGGAGNDATTAADTSTNPHCTASNDVSGADDGANTAQTQDSNAMQDTVGADTGSVDAAPLGCPTKCNNESVCKDGKCVSLFKPCGGPCAAGTYCDKKSDGGTGTCVFSKCDLPKTWAAETHKISVFQVAQSAQGCDLTGNGKPNNVLGNILKLYPAINEELKKSINDGLFNLLLEAPGFNDKGTEFVIHGLLAAVDPSNSNCSMTSPWATCKFTIDDDNYLGGPAGTTCKPRVLFEPATLKSGELNAGNPAAGQKVVISLPTTPALDVTLSQASLHGYPKLDAGTWKETKSGKLCGIITQQDFDTAIDSVPPDAWKTIQLTKEQVKLIINATLQPDIDTNEDGFADAISVAMVLETVPAKITKMTF